MLEFEKQKLLDKANRVLRKHDNKLITFWQYGEFLTALIDHSTKKEDSIKKELKKIFNVKAVAIQTFR